MTDQEVSKSRHSSTGTYKSSKCFLIWIICWFLQMHIDKLVSLSFFTLIFRALSLSPSWSLENMSLGDSFLFVEEKGDISSESLLLDIMFYLHTITGTHRRGDMAHCTQRNKKPQTWWTEHSELSRPNLTATVSLVHKGISVGVRWINPTCGYRKQKAWRCTSVFCITLSGSNLLLVQWGSYEYSRCLASPGL